MKLFTCPHCGQRIYFENAVCLACGTRVAYDSDRDTFVMLANAGVFECFNAPECACNWTAPVPQGFCRACVLNRTIPDLSVEGNRRRWIRVEAAKKRAVYSLLAFGLEVSPKQAPDDEAGLAFDFLAPHDGAGPGGEHILTGHESGLITLNVTEADSSAREKMRTEMGERYRTLLGHFRHEIGHYYWDRLIRDDAERLAAFRALFGDETADYAAALQAHYSEGAPVDWGDRHISAYAASHPWEDWAESWAHYLHISDTLEMVDALNLPLARLETVEADDLPPGDRGTGGQPPSADFDRLLARWLVLSEASNAINRCMGLPDLYPFVISPVAAQKVAFVHDLLAAVARPRPVDPAIV